MARAVIPIPVFLILTLAGQVAANAALPFVPVTDGDGGRRLVAVAKTPDADGICQEIATRIIAELSADGVPVVALTCSGTDPACWTVSGARVAAIVLVQLRDNVRGVEVRAGDAVLGAAGTSAGAAGGRGRVQRLANIESGGAPAVLAVRTVELLRAMLFEVADRPVADETVAQKADGDAPDRERKAVEPPAVADVASGVASGVAPRVAPRGPSNVTMSIGAAMIGSFAGLQAAYGPALSVGRHTSDHVMFSLFLAGPAFGPDQRNAAGTVAIRHVMAAVQADLVGLFWRHFVLRAGIGAGMYHVHIEGQPMLGFPFLNRSDDSYSWMLAWSAGLVANLRSDIGLFVDTRMFVLTPTPVVLLNGLEVGRAGNPGISITTGVEVRL